MGARIIQFAELKARRQAPSTSRSSTPSIEIDLSVTSAVANRFHFWSGASGQRYVHTIYSLIECPEVPSGNYVLVRRTDEGRRIALSIGRARHDAASLNLAEIRQRGAQLGANEVHVHLLAGSVKLSKQIEMDLRAGHMQAPHTTIVSHVYH